MDEEVPVDDIFKSFVSNKLKQLGMSGHTSKDLEKSLQQSALGKLDDKMDAGSSKENLYNDSDSKTKVKKEKKQKKHKKEKKSKKQKKHKEEKHAKSFLENDSKHTAKKSKASTKESKPALKESVLKSEPEDVIKTKSTTPYYETVKKIEKIEKLSLKVETEKKEKVEKLVSINDEKPVLDPSDDKVTGASNNNQPPSHLNQEINQDIVNDKTKTESEFEVDNPDIKSLPNNIEMISKPTTPSGATINTSTNVTSNEKKETIHDSKTKDDSKEESKSPKRQKHSRRHRSRSRSPKHRKHSRSHRSKSRSRSPSRKRSKHSHSHHRSNRSPKHHKHHHHHHHRSHKSRSRDRKHRSSRHRRSPSPRITSRDKMKLLEIAKANVLAQHQAGITATSLSAESKAMLRSGGVTLEQLTDVCKDISDGKREVLASMVTAAVEAKPSKINHPFQVREAPSISINIKNALPPIPNKPVSELTKEFPVSSGSQHQRKEVMEEVYGKWEPIVKDEETKSSMQAILDEKVFPDTPVDNTLSIKDVIAQRVSAVRELQSNPTNTTAIKSMMISQSKIDNWTASQIVPGRFTGSTGLQPLPKKELEKGQQAWVNQRSLNSGKVVGGIGKSLLQKMGWREGEALGRTKFGMVEPIKLQVKTDRKGLSSCMEMPAPAPVLPKRSSGGNHTVLKDLSGKHPVSAIMEVCSKRRWNAPDFVLVQSQGPAHHCSFMFKVMVNGVYYQPAVASANKKQAKAQAAAAALQALGLIPG